MVGTVIEYLKKYGDIPFREKPLNDVDSLALCQLSYLKFDGMVSDVRHNGRMWISCSEMCVLKRRTGHCLKGCLAADASGI